MKPHPTDRISLIFGVAFLAAAILWLTARLTVLHPGMVGKLVVGGLLVLGAAGLVHVITAGRDRARPDHARPDHTGPDHTGPDQFRSP